MAITIVASFAVMYTAIGPAYAESNVYVLLQPTSTFSLQSSSSTITSASSTSIASVTVNCPRADNTNLTDSTDQCTYRVSCDALLALSETEQYTSYRNVRGKFSFAE